MGLIENKINFGCQLYTWQMSGEKYAGKIPDILNTVKKTHFTGIESEIFMLGDYFNNPSVLAKELNYAGIKLAAIALCCEWKFPKETESEKLLADKAIDFLKIFPGTQMATGQLAGIDRSCLYERQKNAISCLNTVAARASDKGISVSFHPNSPEGSIFRLYKDYEILLNFLDFDIIGFCPDTGHIAKAGMDVLDIFKKFSSLINNIHFKDISSNNEWAKMGHGVINFAEIVKFLKSADYSGWIMIEEESEEAETFPDQIVINNGDYVEKILLPLLK